MFFRSFSPPVAVAWAMRIAFVLVVLNSALSPAAAAGVYVSGQKFSLAQALDQALEEHPGASSADGPFWVIVSGPEVKKVTKAHAEGGIGARIREVLERGGIVYVCEPDLARHAAADEPLLEGVETVSGFGVPPEAPAASSADLPDSTAQSRLIQRTCAGEH